jgi:hypothetical protein
MGCSSPAEIPVVPHQSKAAIAHSATIPTRSWVMSPVKSHSHKASLPTQESTNKQNWLATIS